MSIPKEDTIAIGGKFFLNSVFDVLKALSDPKVLAIFNMIALSSVDREGLGN